MKRRMLLSVLLVATLVLSISAPLAAAQTNQPDEPGLVIVRVDADGPAAQAGVKRGNILLSMDGQEINRPLDWFRAMRSLEAGKAVELQVLHGDDERTLNVTVGERNSRAFLGMQVYLGGAEAMAASETFEMPALPVITAPAGAQVLEVVADSPASAAGLQVGDVITAVDGKTLDGESSLADVIAGYQPGDQVVLTVTRAGVEQELRVALGENPDAAARPFLGIRYTTALATLDIPNELMPFLEGRGQGRGLPFGQQGMPFELPFDDPAESGQALQALTAGAWVRSVAAASPAAAAGLQAGDVISAIDGQAVDDPQALVDAITARQPGDTITLTVTRMGATEPLEIEVTLGENPETAGKAYLGVTIGAAVMHLRDLTPGSNRGGGMRFHLPFGLGAFQFDLDQLPFNLDQLPFELPLPGLQQQQPDQSGA
jgi:S1-C subfamily serine protease